MVLKLPWLRNKLPVNANTIKSDINEFPTSFIKKNNIAVVSFVTSNYRRFVGKLKTSFETHYPNADVIIFTDHKQIGCRPHSESPYEFKPYAVEHAKSMGYDIVFWCDSCIRLVKDFTPLLPEIISRGVFLQYDGWATGQWANDRSLDYFGLTRDKSMDISAIYACIMIFDFRQEISHEFLRLWKKSSNDGIFIGKWKNENKTESDDDRCLGHRHDQTCAEIISYQLGIPRGYLVVVPNNIDNPNRYFTSWDHI
jgi:hypothetical protein